MLDIILAALIGLLFGNFMTAVYSRSKARKPILGIGKNGMKPHCDNCNHELKYYEYFPILSWIYCRFKCRECGYKYSMNYFYIEITFSAVSIILHQIFSFSYEYLILFFTSLIIIFISIKIYYSLKR